MGKLWESRYTVALELMVLFMLTGTFLYGKVHEESGTRGTSGTAGAEWDSQEDVKPKIALTFDDGPHPVYTPKLLDGLKERGVHATFFLIGKNIVGNEDIVRRMREEGHLIGNHTYNHVQLTKLSGDKACKEILDTNALIEEVTGSGTEFIRPPFGAWNSNLECGIELIPILWSIDPLDWKTYDTAAVVSRVVKNTEENDIILLHDYYETSVEAALQIVDILQKEGYEFVTADQLILE